MSGPSKRSMRGPPAELDCTIRKSQGGLLQAEIEDSLARLTVWRSLLGQALAQGDLQRFFEVARKSTSGGQ
jgi:hypothetical protein